MGDALFSKIKLNIIEKLLRFSENISEKLSKIDERLLKKMGEELSKNRNPTEMNPVDDQPRWNRIRDAWEQIRGKESIADQFKDSALMLMEYRILQDYGSHLDKNHGLIQREKRIREELSNRYYVDWIDVSAALEMEEERSQRARAATSDESEWPAMPWRGDVIRAVMDLGTDLTSGKLTWEIHKHARRSKSGVNGVNTLIRKGVWYDLATQILKDLEALDFVFPPSRSDDKKSIKLAIERLRDQYFHGCRRLESGGLFCEPKWDFWDPNGIGRPSDKEYARRNNREHLPATTE